MIVHPNRPQGQKPHAHVAGLVTTSGAGSAVITASYQGTTDSASLSVQNLVIPPDPATVAPSIDPSLTTSTLDTMRFLYEGPSPIQTGVTPGIIEKERAAAVRGVVRQRGGTPLTGVRVTIPLHPELGQTVSRADGRFDLAVNGGGALTVRYEKRGYISADRLVRPSWNETDDADDVVLIPYDSAVTLVDLTAAGIKVARGSAVADSDGSRRATLLMSPSTNATMTLSDGTLLPLSSLNIRATEYTIGADGPAAMPAALPPQSGYTYCVELSADEAGGRRSHTSRLLQTGRSLR